MAPAPTRPGGATFGGYELLGGLGQGAMGTVYRARERASGRQVALKVIRAAGPGLAREERFKREAELARGLDHPGIVRVLDAGEQDGVPFIAFELIEGGRTLRDVLPPLAREARAAMIRDVARAIGHAHSRGVVHRDLKPENVLVDALGVARVADFGLATARGLARLTNTGALLGSPLYMSPEQIGGERERVGPPSDVWSLGVMLHEALLGETPFPLGTSLVELAVQIRERVTPPPHTVDPEVPRALSDVCTRALAIDPAQRFADGEALARALDQALGLVAPRRRRRRRDGRPRALLVGGGALLAVIVAAAVALRDTTPPVPATDAPATVAAAETATTPTVSPTTPPVEAAPPTGPFRSIVAQEAPNTECSVMQARKIGLVALPGGGLCALLRKGRAATFESFFVVQVSRDGGLTWTEMGTTRGVLPMALLGAIGASADGSKIHVGVHGGDPMARNMDGWVGSLDVATGRWDPPLERVFDAQVDTVGWLDASLGTDPSGGPVFVGTSIGQCSYFRRRGPNGWTPARQIPQGPQGTQACVAAGPDGALHFVYMVPASIQGAPGSLWYRRWDDFDWAPEGALRLEAVTSGALQLDVDDEGTVHVVHLASGRARYARRPRGAPTFETFDVTADGSIGNEAEVALVITPRVGVVALRDGRIVLWDLTDGAPGPGEVVADLTDEPVRRGLSVMRRAPPGRRLAALVVRGDRRTEGERVQLVLE